jgi:hypothetical protein
MPISMQSQAFSERVGSGLVAYDGRPDAKPATEYLVSECCPIEVA